MNKCVEGDVIDSALNSEKFAKSFSLLTRLALEEVGKPKMKSLFFHPLEPPCFVLLTGFSTHSLTQELDSEVL